MVSVALAFLTSPRDPLDNLQACPTVCKSRMLKESTPLAFFCQTPVSSARQSHVIIVQEQRSCFHNTSGIAVKF